MSERNDHPVPGAPAEEPSEASSGPDARATQPMGGSVAQPQRDGEAPPSSKPRPTNQVEDPQGTAEDREEPAEKVQEAKAADPEAAAKVQERAGEGSQDEPTRENQEPTDDATQRAGGGGGAPAWLRPRVTLPQVVIMLLCIVAGFMVAAQLRQTQDEALTGMRQDDLVRLLDELSQRNEDLAEEGQQLRQELAELRSSTSNQQSAQEAVEQQAEVYGVLAGVLPVRGPGIELTISDPQGTVPAQTQVTILEELRNAGVEAVELSGVRLGASSWIVDDEVDGVIVDGQELSPPYHWRALGDPETLSGALGIPGGALASVRNNGGSVELVESENVTIHAVRTLEDPEHARPVEGADDE